MLRKQKKKKKGTRLVVEETKEKQGKRQNKSIVLKIY